MVHIGKAVGRLGALWPLGRGNVLNRALIEDIQTRLESEKNALEAFTTAMENEFLDLGSLLRKITWVANQVKERSGEVMAAAAGHTEDAALQFAFQLLKKAEDLVEASREQHAAVFGVFERMHAHLRQIARERDALMRSLSPLDSTNTQFRIQACAFDESTRAQFSSLADSIGGIVRQVQTAVGERFEELERAGQATGELVTQLHGLAHQQKIDTDRMLAGTREHLGTLNQALLASEAAAGSIAQSGDNIAAGVARAIMALQCQDMAHQKFQHISAAIDEMAAHLRSRIETGLHGTEEADARHFLTEASRVQSGQLRTVFEQLHAAAREIQEGLEQVESESASFAGHALHSGSAALDGRMIPQAIESIHCVLGVIEKAVESIRGVGELVQNLKSTFRDCTSQILNLALSLRMVALNAQLFAAHVEEGTALEVVARNTRTIADEAMQQLDDISRRVTAMVQSVVDLESRLADYRELAAMEQKHLVAEAEESEKKLLALEANLRSAVAGIQPLERELANLVDRATAAIHFPAAVAQASSRSIALFDDLALQYSGAATTPNETTHHKVSALKRNYTMAHERDVHDSALGPSLATGRAEVDNIPPLTGQTLAHEPARTAPADTEEEEHLADNVELF